jgi:glucokinase
MALKWTIPVAFKRNVEDLDKPIHVLAGDIGGTKTNIACCRIDHDGIVKIKEGRFVSREFSSFTGLIKDFSSDFEPERICFAVAGPVIDGAVQFTNLPWKLESRQASADLGGVPVAFINDLEATAFGLAALKAEELAVIFPGDPTSRGNIGIVAAGTGLGEAGLYFNGTQLYPFATEGGHSDFAPRNEMDIELYRFLHKRHDHVSWERVLSGAGIFTLWQFLNETYGKQSNPEVITRIQAEDPAAVISQAAIAESCPVCVEVMDLFVRYLATESAQLGLKLKSTGGLFLAGGIAPKILPLLQRGDDFANYFIHRNGRMDALIREIKVQVVLNEKLPLLGAACYAGFN